MSLITRHNVLKMKQTFEKWTLSIVRKINVGTRSGRGYESLAVGTRSGRGYEFLAVGTRSGRGYESLAVGTRSGRGYESLAVGTRSGRGYESLTVGTRSGRGYESLAVGLVASSTTTLISRTMLADEPSSVQSQRPEKKFIRPTRSLDSVPMMAAMGTKRQHHGFTLVELMIVIVIIGILMAIAIPAINRTITTGKQTAIRMEINALDQAVTQYMQKHGDYPPDGSSREVLTRHMRRLYPRISEPDSTLLTQLTSIRGSTTFSVVAMDRAEALVFFLGGFSDDALHPLTGEGGPLALSPTGTANSTDINDYQYNGTRDNSFFDFDPARLTYARATETSPLLSTDESIWPTAAQQNEAGGTDVLPVYLSGGSEPTPIVYFDSRTYGLVAPGTYNGFLYPTFGGVRPYKTGRDIKPPSGSTYGTSAEAFAAIPFHNAKTFQIISPGLDGIYARSSRWVRVILCITSLKPAPQCFRMLVPQTRQV